MTLQTSSNCTLSSTAAGAAAAGATQMAMGSEGPLDDFAQAYQGIHGYISCVVCVIGLLFNVMNIIVLTRRNMITSTNIILSALATADMLTMLCYLPYASYFYIYARPDPMYFHSKGWIIYLLFNQNFVITAHTIAMWLTVSLAVFRYIVVCHHTLGPSLCNIRRAKLTIFLVFSITTACCVPNYLLLVLDQIHYDGRTGYWFKLNPMVNEFVKVSTFWLYGVVLKVAPCVLLSVLSGLLLRAMHIADANRRRLKGPNSKRSENDATSEHNRTTAMLLAVVFCFVVTEFPQGILAFLSGVDSNVFTKVYVPLGDVFDITVLVNSAVNFLLYCIMSRQFRKTFKDVFCCPASRCHKASTTSRSSNGVHYAPVASTTAYTKSTRL